MPYKSDKIKIAGGKYDRRIKLTKEDKEEVVELWKDGLSMGKIAKIFNVSKSTIRFVIRPEALAHNKLVRKLRGGWLQYYDRKKHANYSRKTRNYKHKLHKEGLI